jgi:predicted TPR repeat methyltransferase
MGAAIKMALHGLAAPPAALPHGYIAGLFDEYAPRFDRHLVGALGYAVPQALAALIDRLRPAGDLDILDLGCGTGLSGAAVAHRARRLTGIDLSAGMVREAAKKNIYAALHTGDMIAFMAAQAEAGQRYDVLLAADVLVYCGDLDPVFAAAVPLLADGGMFVFSVQAADGDCILGADHRYAYGRGYLESAAARAGMAVMALEKSFLRRDGGRDIDGFLCALARADHC